MLPTRGGTGWVGGNTGRGFKNAAGLTARLQGHLGGGRPRDHRPRHPLQAACCTSGIARSQGKGGPRAAAWVFGVIWTHGGSRGPQGGPGSEGQGVSEGSGGGNCKVNGGGGGARSRRGGVWTRGGAGATEGLGWAGPGRGLPKTPCSRQLGEGRAAARVPSQPA